jgi:hypothetical protein
MNYDKNIVTISDCFNKDGKEAFTLGVKAAEEGVPKRENPFRYESPEWMMWNRGYNTVLIAVKKEMPHGR